MASSSASSSTAPPPLQLHSRVQVTRIGQGTVLFVGQTSFAPGLWVGIALDPGTPGGKNDGSVQGKRYFDVEPGMGVFVRHSQVQVLSGPDDYQQQEDIDQGDYYGDDYDQEEEEQSVPYTRSSSSRPSSVALPQQPRTPGMRRTLTSTSTGASNTASRSQPTSTPASRLSSAARPAFSSTSASARGTSPVKPATRPGVRTSISSASSTTSGRRSLAPSPAKASSTTTRGTAQRPVSSTPMSGRSSAASATTPARPSTGLRRPPATVNAARASITTPRTAAPAPRTSIAPNTATPRVSTQQQQPRTLTRPTATATTTRDRQATAAQAGLKSVAKARPSMAATTATRTAAKRPPSFGQVHNGGGDLNDDEDDDEQNDSGPLSPSAQARKRLDAARANTGAARTARHVEQEEDGEDDDDEDDLVNMSLESATRSQPSLPSSMSSMEMNSLKRQLEEYKVKIRLAEKRRDEDRSRVKELEKWQEEVGEKLRLAESSADKLHTMDGQLLSLQTSEKELSLIKSDLEERIDDLTEQLEMAALDREVAEEKAEAATSELDSLRQVNEELQLEVEVLREENALYESGPVDENERSSTGWLQMEKQNQRLKEALIRLRDMSGETDQEQRRRISELEKELSSLADVSDSRDILQSKLEASEAQLEDVKIQLDDALGAEEMLEELTERNLFLGERMSEMTSTIEELESLKELNEELEEIHIETEKQLQEEIDLKEISLLEKKNKIEMMESNMNEYQVTFTQFREVILTLQGDLELLRRESATTETNSNQSKELMNLNLKLQSSNLKTQSKKIEMELTQFYTNELSTKLQMVQPYLPTGYFEKGDSSSIDGVLFFKRMSSKADLIRNVLEANHEVSTVLNSLSGGSGEAKQQQTDSEGNEIISAPTGAGIPSDLVSICQLRHSLAHFSAVCSSTAAMLQQCPSGTFLKCGRIYKEIQSVIESRIDAYIDSLKKEELKEVDCMSEFKRFTRQFEELSYTLFLSQEEEEGEVTDGDLAAKEVGSAILLDLDLDTLTAVLSSCREVVGSLYTGRDSAQIDWQTGTNTLEETYFTPLEQLLVDIKSSKTLSRKLSRRLTTLASNDEAVSMDAIGDLPSLGRMSSKMVAFALVLHGRVTEYVDAVKRSDGGQEGEDRSSTSGVFSLQSVLEIIRDASRELREQQQEEGDDDDQGETRIPSSEDDNSSKGPWSKALWRSSHLSKTIASLVSAATDQSNVIGIMSNSTPWRTRSATIHELSSRNVAQENQLLKLQQDLKDVYHQVKLRDGLLSENEIKLSKFKQVLSKNDNIENEYKKVVNELNDTKARVKSYSDLNESLSAELDTVEKSCEELRQRLATQQQQQPVPASKATENGVSSDQSEGLSTMRTKETISIPHGEETQSGFLNPRNNIGISTNYETHYLLDQLDCMRNVIRQLRSENALLQSHFDDSLSAVDELLPLSHHVEENEIKLEGLPHQSRLEPNREELRSIESERKQLYRNLLSFVSTPQLVSLSPPPTVSSTDTQRGWRRKITRPDTQYNVQMQRVQMVLKQVEKLQAKQQQQQRHTGRLKKIEMPVLQMLSL
ncbi:unnamed protein product [Sympodiomycopsis kandeliae]